MRSHYRQAETSLDSRELDTGLSLAELAQTAYDAYRSASVGAECNLPPWQDIGEGKQASWQRVVQEISPIIDEAEGLSWLTIARSAHTVFGSSIAYEEEPPAVKLCWVAAMRHLANMLDWQREDGDPIEKHVLYWQGWMQRQLALQQGEKTQ